MKKGEEDRSTEKRKPTCPKCSNVQCVFAVFVKMGDLIFSKCAKTIVKKQGKMRGAKVAKTRETSDNFGILTRLLGLLGASWGPLGGPPKTVLSRLKPSHANFIPS